MLHRKNTYYHAPITITTPIGNNAFSYEARQLLGSDCTITIPSLEKGTLQDIAPGSTVVFEEVDEYGNIHSCNGLKHLWELSNMPIPTYVMDNHNHAFYFWGLGRLAGSIQSGTNVIHIDQHADMAAPQVLPVFTDLESAVALAQYTNEKLNVGNFIVPAQHSGMIGEVAQVRSESKLTEVYTTVLKYSEKRAGRGIVGETQAILAGNTSIPATGNYILDIDIDFWSDHPPTPSEIMAVKGLYQHAQFCTIALSPYFMDIKKAIEVMKVLMG